MGRSDRTDHTAGDSAVYCQSSLFRVKWHHTSRSMPFIWLPTDDLPLTVRPLKTQPELLDELLIPLSFRFYYLLLALGCGSLGANGNLLKWRVKGMSLWLEGGPMKGNWEHFISWEEEWGGRKGRSFLADQRAGEVFPISAARIPYSLMPGHS